MNNQRIKFNDSTADIFHKMSCGNPGAVNVLIQLMKKGSEIDPQNVLGGFGYILQLDSIGIYGTDICVLHNDICDRDLTKTIAVLRSVQLGFFNGQILKDACSRQDYSGKKLIPVEELYQRVKQNLIQFDNIPYVFVPEPPKKKLTKWAKNPNANNANSKITRKAFPHSIQ